ncbi:MAG: hypothetical protein L0I94_03955, partial [Yaniella sp.]|nr:hypothetical protein [Yaniella sp.]
ADEGTETGSEDGTEAGAEDGTEDGTEDGSEDDGDVAAVVITSPSEGDSVTGDTVVVTGTGEPDASVEVSLDDQVETVEVDANGDWSVEFTEVVPGDYTVTATDQESSDAVDITVTADEGTETGSEDGTEAGAEDGTEDGSESGAEDGTEAGAEDGTEDGTEDGSEDGTPSVSVEPDSVNPGDEVDIVGEGFDPDTTVSVVVTDDDGNVIGSIESVPVDENGQLNISWTVREDVGPGTLTVVVTDDNDPDASAEAALTVVPTDPDQTGAATDGSDEDGLASTGASGTTLLAAGAGLAMLLGLWALIAGNRRRGDQV